MYDPEVGVWGSTDPAGQLWNTYGYIGNPLSFVDPDGSFFGWTPDMYFMLYTDQGYDLQKSVSPIAFHLNWSVGSEQSGMGYDISYGLPKLSPIAYRKHQGETYYWNYFDESYSGWMENSGAEWSAAIPNPLPIASPTIQLSFYGTSIRSGAMSQTVHGISAKGSMWKVTYENDGIYAMISEGIGQFLERLPGIPTSDADRWRTAAVKADIGGLQAGLYLFTGDPGPTDPEEAIKTLMPDGKWYYTGYTADKYRVGALWFGSDPVRIGRNSEAIRHYCQNVKIHDPRGIPRFTYLDREPEGYFYFGSGSGNTIW